MALVPLGPLVGQSGGRQRVATGVVLGSAGVFDERAPYIVAKGRYISRTRGSERCLLLLDGESLCFETYAVVATAAPDAPRLHLANESSAIRVDHRGFRLIDMPFGKT